MARHVAGTLGHSAGDEHAGVVPILAVAAIFILRDINKRGNES